MFFNSRRPEPVRPGTVLPDEPVPANVARPEYADGQAPLEDRGGPRDAETIERMRRAGQLSRTILERVAARVEPGVTTDALERMARDWVIEAGAYPSTVGYKGFTKALCTSVNEVACHGIPDDRALANGDIISLDLTVYLDGVHGDTCLTVPVGMVEQRHARLMVATDASLAAGIAAVRPGASLRDIGAACERAATSRGYAVVSSFTGHGIGHGFHAEPRHVPHVDDRHARYVLEEGMTLTIEPILTAGDEAIEVWDDGWTAVTADGSFCAQAEHTIVVTATGAEILTVAQARTLHAK